MHFSTALVAGFAAATSAFLIPPNIPDEIKDTRFRGGPPGHFKEFIHHVLEQKTTTIDLACPGCPFITPQNDDATDIVALERDVENMLHLEFDTHDQTFNVNGHPLLPLEKAQQAQSAVIKAHQIRKDNNEESIEVPINFAMEVMPPIPSPHKEGVSLIPVEFTVLGLNGSPVKVNTISIKLIQPPHGGLVIVHTEELPFEQTPGADTCEGAKPWSICRLRAIIMARFKSMMEATKEKTGQVQGWVKEKTGCGKGKGRHGFWRHPHPHADGEHPHRHHGHHGHHRHHRMGHVIHQTLRFFVIPALLGIIGGLAASAIGMLVGQAIVFVYIRAYRRGQRGPARVVEREVVVEDDEKDELLSEDVETLPVYEDAPKYEEAMARDVEAEAVPPEDERQ